MNLGLFTGSGTRPPAYPAPTYKVINGNPYVFRLDDAGHVWVNPDDSFSDGFGVRYCYLPHAGSVPHGTTFYIANFAPNLQLRVYESAYLNITKTGFALDADTWHTWANLDTMNLRPRSSFATFTALNNQRGIGRLPTPSIGQNEGYWRVTGVGVAGIGG